MHSSNKNRSRMPDLSLFRNQGLARNAAATAILFFFMMMSHGAHASQTYKLDMEGNRISLSEYQSMISSYSADIVTSEGIEISANEFQQTGASVAIQDSLALVALYHSMRGHTWEDDSGWLTDQVVFWIGVDRIDQIGDEWRVTRLSFFPSRYNMTECGYIGPEIGELTYLARFSAYYQQLCGTFPEEITNLQYLDRITTRANYMTGEVPWIYFYEMERFERIQMEQNQWRGDVFPAEAVERLPNLYNYYMDENTFLTGRFPDNMNELTNINHVHADGLERIHGPIPNFAGTNIDRLEIENSNFDPGPWPEWLRESTQIRRVKLHNTNRTGPVPQWLTELGNLTQLGVGGMEMHSPMAEWPDLSLLFAGNLRELTIHGGDFEGDLPAWFADIPSLERLWIQNTNTGGDMEEHGYIWAAQAGSLSLLKLENTNFSGRLPEQLSLATGMNQLSTMYSNLEIGELPTWVGQMTSLEQLYLAD
jgi:hypothetical protein